MNLYESIKNNLNETDENELKEVDRLIQELDANEGAYDIDDIIYAIDTANISEEAKDEAKNSLDNYGGIGGYIDQEEDEEAQEELIIDANNEAENAILDFYGIDRDKLMDLFHQPKNESNLNEADDLVATYKELPYADFKAQNGIGKLTDGRCFVISDDNEVIVFKPEVKLIELKNMLYNFDDADKVDEFINTKSEPISNEEETKILVKAGRLSKDALEESEGHYWVDGKFIEPKWFKNKKLYNEFKKFVDKQLKDGAIDDPEYVNTLSPEEYNALLVDTWMKDQEEIDMFEERIKDNLEESEKLNETTNKELNAKEEAFRKKVRQALKDNGDSNSDNMVGWVKRLPEDIVKELEQEEAELRCISMLHSILTYSNNRDIDILLQDRYLQKYIDELGIDKVKELATQEINEFNNAEIINDVYTDTEGVTYNSVKFKDESENLNESAAEDYWDATELDRVGFYALLKFNHPEEHMNSSMQYIITNDNNEVYRFAMNGSDEKNKDIGAKIEFRRYINKEESENNKNKSIYGTKKELFEKFPELKNNKNYDSYADDDYMAINFDNNNKIKGIRLATKDTNESKKLNEMVNFISPDEYDNMTDEDLENYAEELKVDLHYHIHKKQDEMLKEIKKIEKILIDRGYYVDSSDPNNNTIKFDANDNIINKKED